MHSARNFLFAVEVILTIENHFLDAISSLKYITISDCYVGRVGTCNMQTTFQI
jgi:hypothetical protein